MDALIRELPKSVKADTAMAKEVIDFHQAWLPSFTDDWEQAKDRVNLLYDEHWSQEEKNEHISEGRLPLNVPLLFAKVLSLLGFEKQNSNLLTLEPEGKEDELTAEIGTIQMKRIQKKSHWEYLRSEAFFSGIVPLFGVYKIEEEVNEEGDIEARIVNIPYSRIIFERNFKRYDMTDCYRIQEFEWVYPEDLELEDRFTKEDFDFASSDEYSESIDVNDEFSVPLDSFLTDEVELEDGTKINRRAVKRIHDYKKINSRIYEVHKIIDVAAKFGLPPEAPIEDWMTPGLDIFETRDEAEQYINESYAKLMAFTLQAGLPIEATEEYFIIKPKLVRRIQYTRVVGNREVLTQTLPYADFKHIFYFSIFHLGKFWSVFQISKDMQKYYDRVISQLDYSIGTETKTSFDIVSTLVDTSINSLEEYSEALAKGKNTFSLGHGAISPNPKAGANPEYFKVLEILGAVSDDTWGGKPLRGMQEYSQQSGKAIDSLQQAGAVLSLNYLANLEHSDLLLGERLLETIQRNYDRKLVLKVNGSDLNERVIQALQTNKMYSESATKEGLAWVLYNPTELPSGVRPLSDASFEVSVTKTSTRDDESEILFNKLLNFAKITGVMPPPEMFADAMNFNATQKSMLIQAVEQHRQQQAEQAEIEREMAAGEASLKAMDIAGKQLNVREQNRINAEAMMKERGN